MDKDIRFIPHAEDKFTILAEKGFKLTREQVINTLRDPDALQARGHRQVARRSLSRHYRLNVVFTEDAETITVITFFPSRKERP